VRELRLNDEGFHKLNYGVPVKKQLFRESQKNLLNVKVIREQTAMCTLKSQSLNRLCFQLKRAVRNRTFESFFFVVETFLFESF